LSEKHQTTNLRGDLSCTRGTVRGPLIDWGYTCERSPRGRRRGKGKNDPILGRIKERKENSTASTDYKKKKQFVSLRFAGEEKVRVEEQ